MEHVLFYPSKDGSQKFSRVASLEAVAAEVEKLRNGEGIEAITVYSMTEVPLNFKTYYHVEIPGLPAGGPGPASAAPPAAAPAPPPAAAPAPPPGAPSAVATAPAPTAQATQPATVAEAPAGDQSAEVPANGQRGLGFFSR